MKEIHNDLNWSTVIKFSEDDSLNYRAKILKWRLTAKPHAWRPPTDLIETDKTFVVQVEIAGMNVNDFEISFSDHILDINGTRWDKYPDCAFHQMEIPNGDFSTSVEITSPIDEKNISASYKNGFLHVVLPKAKSKRVKVN